MADTRIMTESDSMKDKERSSNRSYQRLQTISSSITYNPCPVFLSLSCCYVSDWIKGMLSFQELSSAWMGFLCEFLCFGRSLFLVFHPGLLVNLLSVILCPVWLLPSWLIRLTPRGSQTIERCNPESYVIPVHEPAICLTRRMLVL